MRNKKKKHQKFYPTSFCFNPNCESFLKEKSKNNPVVEFDLGWELNIECFDFNQLIWENNPWAYEY